MCFGHISIHWNCVNTINLCVCFLKPGYRSISLLCLETFISATDTWLSKRFIFRFRYAFYRPIDQSYLTCLVPNVDKTYGLFLILFATSVFKSHIIGITFWLSLLFSMRMWCTVNLINWKWSFIDRRRNHKFWWISVVHDYNFFFNPRAYFRKGTCQCLEWTGTS